MSFKDNSAETHFPLLAGFTSLRVAGPDAGRFLQAQLMNDVSALTPGRWQWNGWLNAKGRVIALFALLRTGVDEYLLVLPDFPARDLSDALRRFVFRAKLTLDPLDGWRCAADFADRADRASGDTALGATGSGWAMDFGGDGEPRQLHLLAASDPRLAAARPETDARWRSDDIALGLPRLGDAQRERWTPQMLSLDRLRAFSLRKGCYPGQEIVARTHYLGQAKRILARLQGKGLDPGSGLLDGRGQAAGEWVCVDAEGREGLAVVSSDVGEDLFGVDGERLARLPLLNGLQRPV